MFVLLIIVGISYMK
ncbi:hypothetical protein ACM26V_05695 [Salipaludibacillus sp. HK11]